MQGLKEIHPQQSTHQQDWVYATKDLAMSAVFLSGKGGDFTCSVGRDSQSNKVYICERYAGAFEFRYQGVAGAIYALDGRNFLAGQTHWEEEVVSARIEPVRAEIKVNDAGYFLHDMCERGQILLKRYPERIDHIPEDDEDLVLRAILWTRKFGDKILDQVQRYHPYLLDRVLYGLESGKYLEE